MIRVKFSEVFPAFSLPGSPFQEVRTEVVAEGEELPQAPILWEKLEEERRERKLLGYEFATLAELVLYFYTLRNTRRGNFLYLYFLDAFLWKYGLEKERFYKQPLSEKNKEIVREIGQKIYEILTGQDLPAPFLFTEFLKLFGILFS